MALDGVFLFFISSVCEFFFNVVSKMSMMEHMGATLYEGDP